MIPTLPKLALSLCLGLLVLGYTALAQTSIAEAPTFPNVVLDPSNLTLPISRERSLGWVSGRVIDTSNSQALETNGLMGVKVILRSLDPAYSNFVREQITNENGIYDFSGLAAGYYTVILDAGSLPAIFRVAETTPTTVKVTPLDRTYADLSVEPQRTITGVVFIDKDGDGKYAFGSDEPVIGARLSFNGIFSISGPNGSYTIQGMPSGRVAFLITAPQTEYNVHVVLDMPEKILKPRIVNVPLLR